MISRRLLLTTLCVAAALFTPRAARADSITLGASMDNSIFQNSNTVSNGGGPGLFSGSNGMLSPRRGLIEFNIAAGLPANATITGVSLQLTVGQTGGGTSTARTISLFTLSRDWGEGTAGNTATSLGGTGQGSPAGTGDATWAYNHYNATLANATAWTTAGGDHAATASATATSNSVTTGSYFTWSGAGLVTDVQNWYDNPSANNGWEIINGGEAASQSLVGFYTREGQQVSGVTASQLPQLTINYTVPEPACGGVLLAGAGLCWAVRSIVRRRRA